MNREKIIQYLTPKIPQITDQQSEAIAEIRRLWESLPPTLQLGMISELAGRLYQAELRR